MIRVIISSFILHFSVNGESRCFTIQISKSSKGKIIRILNFIIILKIFQSMYGKSCLLLLEITNNSYASKHTICNLCISFTQRYFVRNPSEGLKNNIFNNEVSLKVGSNRYLLLKFN